MGYGQQYFKNRKAVKELQQMVDENCISISEAEGMGINRRMIKKWEKDGRIGPIRDKGKLLYNYKILQKLYFEKISK